jgi:transcription initiation factor TFIID subunit 9B
MASDDEDKELDIPRDAKIIALILQSMGIQDCEPRVIEQLLEFIHSNIRQLLNLGKRS